MHSVFSRCMRFDVKVNIAALPVKINPGTKKPQTITVEEVFPKGFKAFLKALMLSSDKRTG